MTIDIAGLPDLGSVGDDWSGDGDSDGDSVGDDCDGDDLITAANALPRRAFVEHHMAMPWSIHVRGPAARVDSTPARASEAFALVARIDAELSPFRADSALTAYRDGWLSLADAPQSLRDVHALALTAREETDGVFDAWGWRDGFDPTGLTKGWAIGQVTRLLADLDGDVAVVASGDLEVRSPSGLPWRTGIEDPRARSRILGWIDVINGAVATSGSAARGAHIIDPRPTPGSNGPGVLSATVVTDDVVRADVWATAAVALGADASECLRLIPATSGLLLTADGVVHRWADTRTAFPGVFRARYGASACSH